MSTAGDGLLVRPMRLDADTSAVTSLITEYVTWAIGRLKEEYGLTESPTDVDEIEASLAAYTPPNGLMLVAERHGTLVGVAALRTLEPGIVEIKRMYVTPPGRGQHVASSLLDRLLLEACETFHAGAVRLDTSRFMTDAQRLYQSRGFTERAPYKGSEIPPHLQQHWRFFERALS